MDLSKLPAEVRAAMKPGAKRPWWLCSDGPMAMSDVARLARVSVKKVERAFNEFWENNDEEAMVPMPVPPVTRMQMAIHWGNLLRLGTFAARQRAAEAAPPPKKEKHLGIEHHPYKAERGGRSLRSEPGRVIGVQTCRCGNVLEIGFRQLAGSQQMDQKFTQKGWRLDPAKCPSCITPIKMKETPVGEANSMVKSQAKLFRLLSDHFNGDTGVYDEGWSDAKVSTESGLAPGVVKTFRDEAFGELKEPPEFAALAADIHAVDQLIASALRDTVKPLQDEVEKLKGRLADLRRKWPQN